MGLDFEMAINEHYSEVMDVIDKLFVYIFDGLNSKHSKSAVGVQMLCALRCVPPCSSKVMSTTPRLCIHILMC